MDKLVLIDGNSLLNRAYYATPVFTTKDGQPTNAIFGFVKLMLKIIGDLKPEYLAVAFDLKAPTFRHKMYDGYKATRKPMPPELAAQVAPLKSLLSAMKIAMFEKGGLEADDIVGTLSNRFDVHSYVYTGDRDSYQLVDEKTDVFFTKRGVSDLLKLDKDNFEAEVGVKPRQIIDLKALMGDKSDNIPGVPGIGEKTALNLVQTYGSLDGVYENIDGIKGATKDKLVNGRDLAYLSYTLATIDRNCQIDAKLEDCSVPKKYSAEVLDIFNKFEFKSLLTLDIFEEGQRAEGDKTEYPERVELKNEGELSSLCEKDGSFYIDFDGKCAKIYAFGVQYECQISYDLLGGISADSFFAAAERILSNKEAALVVYDLKKFLHDISYSGDEILCRTDDVSVMKYLADFFDQSQSIEELCKYYGYDSQYSAYVLCTMYDIYCAKLREDGGERLYEDIEKPLIFVLFDMERTGVKVDIAALNDFSAKYHSIIDELSARIFELCGEKFNLNSPTQLGQILFEKLGLKSGKKNKNGKYSTNAEILEQLADESEAVRLILKYRQYQKLCSTYVEGFRPLIDNGLVHTTYNQTVTATGRLSSTNPNLQNIPIREDEGRELRKLFIPRDGNVFIDADYSQIELRLLAHFSGCKELVEAYNDGQDIHAVTASQVFGVPLSEVSHKMRSEAKAVNFGIIYGISDFGLAKNLNIPVKTAREYIDNYFKTYSAVKDYMNSNVEFAKKNGYVSTLTGRKRYIREISSSNYNIRQFGERAAMNMPLQGSSADIIKIAMINVEKALKEEGLSASLILQVHDELVLDCPEAQAERAAKILKREMENAVKLKVPLIVDVHTGKNWYEAK